MPSDVFELITSVALGGAENVAFELAQHCAIGSRPARLVIVELFRSRSDYAVRKRQELTDAGVRIITLSPFGKRASLLLAPFALAWHVLHERPQVIHSHTDLPDLVLASFLRIARLLRLHRPKVLRTMHNVALWPTYPRLGTFVESAFQREGVAAVSDAALRAYVDMRQSRGLVVSATLAVIYNGCRPPGRKTLPFDLRPGRRHILFCGRFEPQKGVDVLALRMREIQRRHPATFCFHLVGSGRLQPLLDAVAHDTPDVQVHPPINGISDYLHAFDFMILPSRFEGLALVSIEASLAGLPVIAARAPGLQETLPGQWPLYFDLESAASMLPVFDRIAACEIDRAAVAALGQAFANEFFLLTTMIRKYDQVFTRLLAEDPDDAR